MDWLNPDSFNFENAPLNKFWHGATACIVYLATIFFLEARAKKNGVSPRRMRILLMWQICHNLFLSVASLFMVVSALWVIFQYKTGWFPDDPDTDTPFLTCTQSARPATGRIFYWVYLFYLSKYLELLDTVIQMMKGRRPPSFYFHIWHHTMYLLICWGYCHYRSSLSLLAVVVNGGVHVVMYYYYHLSARGVNVWWKHNITRMQIVQFIGGYAFFSMHVKQAYFDKQPCNGKGVLQLHAVFNMTMLLGFVRILGRIRRTATLKKVSGVRDEVETPTARALRLSQESMADLRQPHHNQPGTGSSPLNSRNQALSAASTAAL